MPFQPFFNPYATYNPMQQGQVPYGQGMQGMQGVQNVQQIQEQPVHGFVYVQGIEGARAYHLPNGSEMPLFDNDQDILYVKTVDQSGRMDIKVKDCFDHIEQPSAHQEYATRGDVRAIYAEIETLREAISSMQPKPAHTKE